METLRHPDNNQKNREELEIQESVTSFGGVSAD